MERSGLPHEETCLLIGCWPGTRSRRMVLIGCWPGTQITEAGSDWLLAWYPDHGGWGMRLVVLAGTGQLSGGCVDVIGLGLRLSLSPSES